MRRSNPDSDQTYDDENDAKRHGISAPMAGLLFLVVGMVSAGYCLYDLVSPSHFVGDMYGMEVLARLRMLLIPSALMLVGGVILFFISSRDRQVLSFVGVALIAVSSVAFAVAGRDVLRSRQQDEVRNLYPTRSTEELLRIAQDEGDMFAIEELLVRRDPASVPGLCEILRDDDKSIAMRSFAAHALGEVGGNEARATLEEVLAERPVDTLKVAIDYALETRMGEREQGD